jgi:hypothetical protein
MWWQDDKLRRMDRALKELEAERREVERFLRIVAPALPTSRAAPPRYVVASHADRADIRAELWWRRLCRRLQRKPLHRWLKRTATATTHRRHRRPRLRRRQ